LAFFKNGKLPKKDLFEDRSLRLFDEAYS